MNEGKLMNVSHSTISTKDKSLTNARLSQKWRSIDWHVAEKSVNKLQVRITKAVIQNKWHLVKRLEYLLTHSYYAKLLAVRKVTQNKGKRTAGIDGNKWLTPESKMIAALSLTGNRYKAQPLRRVFIQKRGKKKKRPLGIPTMYDRAMQCLYSLALEAIAEVISDSRSFGFRKFRSTKDSCQQVFTCLSRKMSAQWILEGDIKGCFDHINHRWLLDNIPMDKSILTQFLKAGFVYQRHLNPTKAGTPQGGLISPILANMALDGIEKLLLIRYPKRGRKYCKVNFVRYCDDFVVTADSEETAGEIKDLLKTFLKERGLELSDDKTLITNINEGFDFLGWNFRKTRGKLLIKPSKESIQKFVEKVSQTIKSGKSWPQELLISKINPIIRGWTNYHRSVVSSEIFRKLDHILWEILWKWAKRRHPNKSKRWIAKKYWKQSNTRRWNFQTENNRLLFLSDTRIQRHIPLKLQMNPFLDNDYFHERQNKLRFMKVVPY
ncbi:group II intron reverse transcriptase/maturase [Methanosarcina mazei]|uniref:DNA polymerase n=1 Tax=Methanosarcina mazei TaxID=2209 RepID=A0A0F8IKL3_METMZ|nr:group II intron reverse transcriptase/maturase [Methanosarcina mazei]KKG07021.1 DNA polymerase [Methanosarcina mazei]KKG58387.1 DNA polymerase [Methanosarcina mazei]KKG60891.1 DNA polymerase [Methanosarcina mazei]KKG64018.1 DNA polymerase [Methanosarcina mazei]KKH91391.1 DNA polymerase [Methanosarcina mazei]